MLGAPKLVVDAATTDRLVGVLHQQAEKLGLALGQANMDIAEKRLSHAHVEHQLPDLHALALILGDIMMHQMGAQPLDQFDELEWLGDKIIGAGVEAIGAVAGA